MKILQRKPMNISVESGDSLILSYDDCELLREEITEAFHVNEVLAFQVEPSDFGEDIEAGIGGAFLQKKEG